jgi:hypothetical protein
VYSRQRAVSFGRLISSIRLSAVRDKDQVSGRRSFVSAERQNRPSTHPPLLRNTSFGIDIGFWTMTLPLALLPGVSRSMSRMSSASHSFITVQHIGDSWIRHLISAGCQRLIRDQVELRPFLQEIFEFLRSDHKKPGVRNPSDVAEPPSSPFDEVLPR